MADVTVTQFAEVLKVPVEKLLKQFEEAGIAVGGADAAITDDQKGELLAFLRRSHGRTEEDTASAGPRKITLKRKTQSEIKVNAAQGRARTVREAIGTKGIAWYIACIRERYVGAYGAVIGRNVHRVLCNHSAWLWTDSVVIVAYLEEAVVDRNHIA